jgi:hypothetical protein
MFPQAGTTASRIAAASIAAIASLGLGVQCIVLYRQNGSALLTLWIVLAFFTITTNLLVAVVFTCVAAARGSLRANWIVAGTMLSIMLVGVTYTLLLHGLIELSGGSAFANAVLHWITPAAVPLFWTFFTPKGTLTWKHPFLWAIYPLAYLAYALARGSATGNYAYPFLNVLALGWQQTAINAIAIAIAFMLCAFLIVWIDHRMAPRDSLP